MAYSAVVHSERSFSIDRYLSKSIHFAKARREWREVWSATGLPALSATENQGLESVASRSHVSRGSLADLPRYVKGLRSLSIPPSRLYVCPVCRD